MLLLQLTSSQRQKYKKGRFNSLYYSLQVLEFIESEIITKNIV